MAFHTTVFYTQVGPISLITQLWINSASILLQNLNVDSILIQHGGAEPCTDMEQLDSFIFFHDKARVSLFSLQMAKTFHVCVLYKSVV